METPVQYIVALILAATTAWFISIIGAGAIERAVSAFAQLVGGWRPDPWPRGVQEEDRDRPWGWRFTRTLTKLSQGTIGDSTSAVSARRVKARTTPR